MLDLSSDEETVEIAHSFCSDFQGMHLWESSFIQAPAQRLDMQSRSLHRGRARELNHVSSQERPEPSHGAGSAAKSQDIGARVPLEEPRR